MTLKWIPARDAAASLGVSERTLQRWRKNNFLKVGIHWRRKFPSSNSPLLYQIELCEKAMSDACARDAKSLELVKAFNA